MSMAEKIKIALIKRNMTLKELATRIGCTSQNLSGKFKRERKGVAGDSVGARLFV